MKHQIEIITKQVKEGIYTKEQAQKKICQECLLHPSWECKRPCGLKKASQRITSKKPKELPQQRQCKGYKLVIEPNNLEIIQKAQLDKIMMVTIEPKGMYLDTWTNRRISRNFPYERKRKYLQSVLGDGHLWIQHLSYKIGSEQSKRTVDT